MYHYNLTLDPITNTRLKWVGWRALLGQPSKGHVGRILIIFLPQTGYKLMNKSLRIHIKNRNKTFRLVITENIYGQARIIM